MALGLIPKRTDFIPIIKYDARSGIFTRVDRVQSAGGQWQSEEAQLKDPEFLCDLAQVEIGWMRFVGVPDFVMVHRQQAVPTQPSDDHRLGFRVLLMLAEAHALDGEAGDLRHFSNSSKTVMGAFDKLDNDFQRSKESNDPDLVPRVKVTGVEALKIRTPQGQSNFQRPVFTIIGWDDYPIEFTEHHAAQQEEQEQAEIGGNTSAQNGDTADDPNDLPFE